MKRIPPELVAPAGSFAAFSAGLESGADAFYFGVGGLNARARAQNFSVDEMETLACAAREAGRKLYLALNVLIRDREIEEVLRTLERAEELQLDAVILQDLGLLDLLRRHFPSLALHASTQMFLHNSLHVEALARRGIRRVVLPRELRLREIRAIRRNCPVQTEVFVHGALCFSFSGACLASSYLLGASGNRGVCKQVCRFAFEGSRARYPFSLKDLEGRTHLEALLRTGVDALKIEGRLRNADYVREAVGYYRQCLDAWTAGSSLPEPPRLWRHGRPTTSGHVRVLPYESMVLAEQDPWIGEHVGDVKRVHRGKASVTFHKKVFPGDRLRVLREDGTKVLEWTLLGEMRSPKEIEVGDRSRARVAWKVYRLGTSRAPSGRSSGVRGGPLKVCPVAVSVRYSGAELTVEAILLNRKPFSATFVLPARKGVPPLPPSRVHECFCKTDRTPFRTERISVALQGPLAVSIRDINALRREFFESLETFYARENEETKARRRQLILRAWSSIGGEAEDQDRAENGRPGPPSFPEAVAYEDFRAARSCADLEGEQEVWVELPLFVSEERLAGLRVELDGLAADRRVRFVCHSLGWIDFLRGRVEADRIASGGYLYCLNRFAYRLLREAGASRILLSNDLPEEDRRALLRLPATAVPRESRLRFFVTRLRLPEPRYRFGGRQLRLIQRTEYAEVVLAAP
ncbi:MAG: U32 family peptidase [bacterium]